MNRLKSVLTVLGAVTILVLAANTVSMAATGKAFILGKGNSAGAGTTLTRTTAGPVLNLRSKSAAGAPLTVNGKGKVVNLNADSVDGYDSAALRDRTYVWNQKIPQASANKRWDFNLTGLPAGTYEVGYSGYPAFDATLGSDEFFSCYFTRLLNGSPASYWAEDGTSSFNSSAAPVSGNAVIQVGGGYTIRLSCAATFPFYAYSAQPMQVYASPTTVVGGSSNLRSLPSGARTKG